MHTTKQPSDTFLEALASFKQAVADLNYVWLHGDHADGDVLGDSYPKYLPSFDEFNADVQGMRPNVKPRPDLPALPPVGTIVRARYDLDMGGHGPWPKGWTGEVVDNDGDAVHVRAHRYLGPNVHEWDNCRVISHDDGVCAYEQDFNRNALDDEQTPDRLVAYALLGEFEVIG